MLNWFIIIAILFVLMALKLTKFIGIAVVLALIVMLIVKNSLFIRDSKQRKSRRRDKDVKN